MATMADVVLDASAILALMFEEPGGNRVATELPNAIVSTVNVSEVATRLLALGTPDDIAETAIASLQLTVLPFDMDQAMMAARLRSVTRSAGLTLCDRACLALAKSRQAPALTADRPWTDVAAAAGVDVQLIR